MNLELLNNLLFNKLHSSRCQMIIASKSEINEKNIKHMSYSTLPNLSPKSVHISAQIDWFPSAIPITST